MDFPLASALLHGALLTLIFLPRAVLSTPLKLTVPSNIVSCTTTTISWQGGSAPYTLTFEENGVTLETAVVINDTTFDWDVDIAPGTVTLLPD
ncbi:hypothetical protein QCA50_007200 [Cerrena zonata]|uniref:Uncharacterized protein n=1 Tax=Cerrena zonata TaxID=2478898 RepID=A0AAW0G6X9_9APHY